MEEDTIKKYLCCFCINSANCCVDLDIKSNDNIKSYKCKNYIRKEELKNKE